MFKRLPSLNSLRVFEAAARLKSFKAAADELNVSPTAISHQVSGLEKTLGIQLFERNFRFVILTPAGEKLAHTCTDILSELSKTLCELQPVEQKVTINSTHAFSAMWLAPHVTNFNHQFPQIKLEILASDELKDTRTDLAIDLLVRYGPLPLENSLVGIIVKDTMGLFATPKYLNQLDENIPINYFLTKWKNKTLFQNEAENILCHDVFENKKIFHYFEDENQVIQAALASQGIAIVSKILVQHSVMQGWLREYSAQQIKQQNELCYYSIIPERNRYNHSVILFQQWLKQQFNQA